MDTSRYQMLLPLHIATHHPPLNPEIFGCLFALSVIPSTKGCMIQVTHPVPQIDRTSTNAEVSREFLIYESIDVRKVYRDNHQLVNN